MEKGEGHATFPNAAGHALDGAVAHIARALRTLSNFVRIVGDLKDRLHRWTQDGQYGFLFDNVEDTLSFSRFQTFNFNGWDDAPQIPRFRLGRQRRTAQR